MIETRNKDKDSLKLTTDRRGKLWAARGEEQAKESLQGLEEVLSGFFRGSGRIIDVPGLARNATLLLQLYSLKLAGRFESLRICTPLCAETAADRDNARMLLYQMRSCAYASSLGGFHEFNHQDRAHYELARFAESAGSWTPAIHESLVTHPAYLAVSFCAGLNLPAVATLLGLVVDPRWWVNKGEPDRIKDMYHHFGLRETHFRTTAATGEIKSAQEKLADLVLSCFADRLMSLFRAKEAPGPHDFLIRHYSLGKSEAAAKTATCRAFVRFLCDVWRAELSPRHRTELLVPEYFFNYEDEVVAFKEHMRAAKTNA